MARHARGSGTAKPHAARGCDPVRCSCGQRTPRHDGGPRRFFPGNGRSASSATAHARGESSLDRALLAPAGFRGYWRRVARMYLANSTRTRTTSTQLRDDQQRVPIGDVRDCAEEGTERECAVRVDRPCVLDAGLQLWIALSETAVRVGSDIPVLPSRAIALNTYSPVIRELKCAERDGPRSRSSGLGACHRKALGRRSRRGRHGLSSWRFARRIRIPGATEADG